MTTKQIKYNKDDQSNKVTQTMRPLKLSDNLAMKLANIMY